MVNKKKRGSSILLVLMVATVMIIISSVVASSLVSTTRMNTVEKREDDILYAAEAGIEQVLSNARKGDYGSLVVGGYITPFNLNVEFNSQDIEVDVTGIVIDVAGKKVIQATSVAKDTRSSQTKEVQGNITENQVYTGGSSNLLKYSICGDNVSMYLSGTVNFDAGAVNSPDNIYIEAGSQTGIPIKEQFLSPSFNESEIPQYNSGPVEVHSLFELKELGKKPITSSQYRGVVYKEISTSETNAEKLDFYFINTPSLILDTTAADIIVMTKTVIISNGNIILIQNSKTGGPSFIDKIDRVTGKPLATSIDTATNKINFRPSQPITLNNSSIIGKHVNIYGSEYHANVPTYDELHPPSSHSSINSTTELKYVMDEIAGIMNSSWGGGVGGTLNSSYEITDVVYP